MQVQFVSDVVDLGSALEVRVSGLASVARPSPGIVQHGYYTRFPLGGSRWENRYSLFVVRDFSQWLAEQILWQRAVDEMIAADRGGAIVHLAKCH